MNAHQAAQEKTKNILRATVEFLRTPDAELYPAYGDSAIQKMENIIYKNQ